jgi:death on curing protein
MNSHNDDERLRGNVLSANDLYVINETVTGRTPFVRDPQLIHSAVRRPHLVLFGQAQFPTHYDKAAATLHSIAYRHPFADGNKRTAIRATELYLQANHITPTWTEDAIEAYVLRVACGEIETDAIAVWLRAHTRADEHE